ncbi:MAG: chalcone isomerase family protein [Pseudomonadota bacterium]
MIKILSTIALTACAGSALAGPADNFDFPPSVDISGPTLQLCSTADMQVFALVDLGDVALYLEDCKHRPFLDQPRLLYFHYGRDFDAEDYRTSGKKLLERNMDSKTFSELEPAIDEFNDIYQATREGDSYAIGTDPQGRLSLYLNGEYIGRSDSMAFARAYFKIWFGEDPFRKNVREALSPPFNQ